MSRYFKVTHDPEAEAAYIRVREGQVTETRDLGNNALLDIDKDGNALGIELLDAFTAASAERWAEALELLARGPEDKETR
ncbi:hypothetical protein HMPREF3159_03445 [Brachybacterium sp. HMSC06H03]|uniref:DUF2283 domain-containing protein n=1 Tax=Brachybacterium sp. HMSC06H03 TaxID=1581127 RepID=UPI0008A2524B|nr:DUF2283 domain-containing protein [Brachybacterium sp. HMSC06H03]OFT62579.1 hypothetical protein HMPREF3159_03445 [Brachybacterium sp. HMSC06H03]